MILNNQKECFKIKFTFNNTHLESDIYLSGSYLAN